jgi:hypothetical protein
MNDSRDTTDRSTSTSDRVPHKPTREGAIGAGASAGRDEGREQLGKERQEVGNARSSARHPPHVTENEEDAPVQEEMPAKGDAPVLPANASGRDSVPVDEQDQPIDDESMYDRRPERGSAS